MNEQLNDESNEDLNEESIEALDEESIEILELDDDSLDDATIRKSFRIPIRDKNRFSIVIQGTSFPIEDINAKGVGVLMVKDMSFFKGQILPDCELILESDIFSGIECQIVHITSMKKAPPLFGVKWLNMDLRTSQAGKKKIGEICDALKKDLLDESIQEQDNDDDITQK
ncbi:MAG: hypothetical protein HQK67_07900 [Desulfamplus sp.]|nr:hypothetical protein [Desulfamplus sp.]